MKVVHLHVTRSSNPVNEERYWVLLRDVFSASHQNRSASKQSRPSKIWLIPLLNRVPIAPIILSFLSIIPKLSSVHRTSLVAAVKNCMVIIWPLAIHKITSDTLLELFGKYIENILLGDLVNRTDEDAVMGIGNLIVSSFKLSLANTSNKKKVSQLKISIYRYNMLTNS